jgi:4-amino-4-deoxy-L-arabinose transferase-like glycosyltransferase
MSGAGRAVRQAPPRPDWPLEGRGSVEAQTAPLYSLLALATLAAAVLRFYGLGANSLWVDEIVTLKLAEHSLSDIVRLSSGANFVPPLYYLLVHGALRALGESEVALRLPSAIAGILTVPVVALLALELTGSRGVAGVAAVLLALNPLHLWFSQEARAYAVLLFFGCCALLFVARAIRTGSPRDWIGYAVFSALTFLTHTTGLLVGAVAFAWVLWSPNRRRHLGPVLVSSMGAILACVPFFIAIAGELAARDGQFRSEPRALTGLELPYTLFTYVAGFSFGPGPRDIQNFGALGALKSHPVQSVVAAAALAAILILAWLRRRKEMTGFAVLLGTWLGGILALSAISEKAYNVRYTLPGLIGFLGLISIAVHGLRPRARAVCLAALAGLSLAAVVQWYTIARYWKEDARGAVAWLRDHLPADAAVAVAPAYAVAPLAHYATKAGVPLTFLRLPSDSLVPNGPPPAALVLTRLHHLPGWRELKASFLGRLDAAPVETQLPGYEILVDPALLGRAKR